MLADTIGSGLLIARSLKNAVPTNSPLRGIVRIKRRRLSLSLSLLRLRSERLQRLRIRNAVIGADHDALDHILVHDDGRIRSRGKLNRRCRHHWKDDVRRLRPRILLLLGDLHGEVHSLLRALKPFRARIFVNLIFADDLDAKRGQLVVAEVRLAIIFLNRDVRRINPAFEFDDDLRVWRLQRRQRRRSIGRDRIYRHSAIDVIEARKSVHSLPSSGTILNPSTHKNARRLLADASKK